LRLKLPDKAVMPKESVFEDKDAMFEECRKSSIELQGRPACCIIGLHGFNPSSSPKYSASNGTSPKSSEKRQSLGLLDYKKTAR
jgi:hypothetical protein